MRRLATLVAVLFVVAGCVSEGEESSTTNRSSTTTLPTEPTSTTVVTQPTIPSSTTSTVTEPELITYLVWTSGGLTDGLTAGLESRFDMISIVTGDAAPLEVGAGQVVPLDAIGLDVDAHVPFDPNEDTAVLRDGTVLLGESSASLRDLGVGDSVVFDGVTFEVIGIAPDVVVGAAEVVFSKTDPASPIGTNRYALIATDLPRDEFEAIVDSVNDAPVPPRIVAEGETPFLRHADGVLPQIYIKMALGEFSYPADSGTELIQDRGWVSENIVSAEVPILGRVTCHRVVVEMLTGALNQLVAEGLEDLIDPGEFAGCWNPRFVRTVTGTPTGVSRHSWGAALDINVASNGLGTEGNQDARLVEIMAEWGFGWGGDWTVPDPMHFEYAIPPVG